MTWKAILGKVGIAQLPLIHLSTLPELRVIMAQSIQVTAAQGLGFQDLSSTGALPPFLNAIQEGQLSQPLFSMWLNPTPGAEPAGELTFGVIDSTKYTGQLAYLSVIQES